ncbi:YbaB/EbfC family nucleoid-associated protein [Buchnera aphidicola (Thelaxes californica)]|uniref:Nucleoid-associated protein D9V80_01885 n=1 Tax=Buchnera aphidicola (Thelaxes californica) TaxID=1315998 RepID=A0A4D6YCU7_9GAMM|nr:YbaB/EbfC family nucleoid-associated protein [Buchnera aphidicola]QCI26892.1 YbaB/EbfC family nucleoid-associated protein [Buchnera aphidicola (Thelaxes californica)]
MLNSNNLNNFIQQAQNMQDKLKKIQKDIESLEITGESGAGLVKVTLFGNYKCKKIEIDNSLLIKEEVEILEDLITAAFNDANRRVTEEKNQKINETSNKFGVPPEFSLNL